MRAAAPPPALAGVYAVLPASDNTGRLLNLAKMALAGGCKTLQWRHPFARARMARQQTRLLAALCRRRRALFLVNDNPRLARACGAAGAHLGRHDMPVARARALLGARAVVGASCYASAARARRAQAAGASYIAFGALFASATKPAARPCPLSIFKEARQLGVVVGMAGIGGINGKNAAAVFAAGANMAAVCGGIFAAADPTRATREIATAAAGGGAKRKNAPRQKKPKTAG